MSNTTVVSSKGNAITHISFQDTFAELKEHWMALLAAIIGTGFGVATLVFYTTGLFVPELKNEYGWTLAQLSLLPLAGAIVIVFMSPLIGALIDKVGTRFPPTISLLFLSAAFILLTLTGPQFSAFLAVWVAMYIFASASSPVSFTRIITTRFDKARGLALGIALGGAGIVAFLVPKILGGIIAQDWKLGYYILSGCVFISSLLFFVLMSFSQRKERLKKEALSINEDKVTTLVEEEVKPISVNLAIKLGAIFVLIPLAVGGMTMHLVPMLRDSGLTALEAASIASLIGISVVFGRIIIGVLIDRIFAPWVAAVVMLLVASGFAMLLFLGPAFSAAAAIGLGLALGAEVDLIGYLTGRYFGLKRYGKFFGIFYALFNVGLGFAPYLVTVFLNSSGSYSLPLAISIGLLLATVILLMTLPKYNYAAHVGNH